MVFLERVPGGPQLNCGEFLTLIRPLFAVDIFKVNLAKATHGVALLRLTLT